MGERRLGPITSDPAAMREHIVDRIGVYRDPVAQVKPLSRREKRLLRDGEVEAVLAGRREELLGYTFALLNASPEQLAKDSFGYQIQDKQLERLFRRALPETLRIEHSGEIRKMPTPELVQLLQRLGLPLAIPALPAHGQNTDTAQGPLLA